MKSTPSKIQNLFEQYDDWIVFKNEPDYKDFVYGGVCQSYDHVIRLAKYSRYWHVFSPTGNVIICIQGGVLTSREVEQNYRDRVIELSAKLEF